MREQNAGRRAAHMIPTRALLVLTAALLLAVGCLGTASDARAQDEVVADAGNDRMIEEGTAIVLNGTRSTGDIIEYRWNFTYDDEPVLLEGVEAQFVFDIPGVYNITLTVVGLNNTDTDVAKITVQSVPTWLESHIASILGWTILVALVAWASISLVRKLKRDKTLVTPSDIEKLQLQIKNLKKTWKIFRSNRLGFAGLITLIAFVVIAVTAPLISTVSEPNDPDNFDSNDFDAGWVNPTAPSFAPSPTEMRQVHPWGTDHLGRDVYSMTMYGTRASLMVGFVATLISVALGASIGLAAGYFGKITDEVLMRVTDFFLVLPWFPLMIVMMAVLGKQFIWVIVVIGITSWPSTARIVRSQVLTVKERQFIERARAVGADSGHIIKKHILPNVLPLVFANTVLLIALAIFSESFLDFFGLGDPTVISWGNMLEAAYNNSALNRGAWWWIVAPGGAIVVMVLAFSLIGYALDDVLNPKLRRR